MKQKCAISSDNEQKWGPYREWPKIDEKERHVASSQIHGKTKNAPKPMRKTHHGHQNYKRVLTMVSRVR